MNHIEHAYYLSYFITLKTYPSNLVSKISFESFSVPERHDMNSFMEELIGFKDMVAAEEHIQKI